MDEPVPGRRSDGPDRDHPGIVRRRGSGKDIRRIAEFVDEPVTHLYPGMRMVRSVGKTDSHGSIPLIGNIFHSRKNIGQNRIADTEISPIEKIRSGIPHPVGVGPQRVIAGRQLGRQLHAAAEPQRIALELAAYDDRVPAIGQLYINEIAQTLVRMRDSIEQITAEPDPFAGSVIRFVEMEIEFLGPRTDHGQKIPRRFFFDSLVVGRHERKAQHGTRQQQGEGSGITFHHKNLLMRRPKDGRRVNTNFKYC